MSADGDGDASAASAGSARSVMGESLSARRLDGFSSSALAAEDSTQSRGAERVLHKPLFSAGGTFGSARNLGGGGVVVSAAGDEEDDGSGARLPSSLSMRMMPSSRLLYSNPNGARETSAARAGNESVRGLAAAAPPATSAILQSMRVLGPAKPAEVSRVLGPAKTSEAGAGLRKATMLKGPLNALNAPPMSAVPATPRLAKVRSVARGLTPATPEAGTSFWGAPKAAPAAAPPGIFAAVNPLTAPRAAGGFLWRVTIRWANPYY